MKDTITTADALRLLDRLSERHTLRLHLVELWGDGTRAHIYAEDEQAARRRVLLINPDARIVSITPTKETL